MMLGQRVQRDDGFWGPGGGAWSCALPKCFTERLQARVSIVSGVLNSSLVQYQLGRTCIRIPRAEVAAKGPRLGWNRRTLGGGREICPAIRAPLPRRNRL
jgi:hypothetical protein